MRREPAYSPQAAAALDALDESNDLELYNAVCDAIDLICDHGDTAEARRQRVRAVDVALRQQLHATVTAQTELEL